MHVVDTAGLARVDRCGGENRDRAHWREIHVADCSAADRGCNVQVLRTADREILVRTAGNLNKILIFNKIDLSVSRRQRYHGEAGAEVWLIGENRRTAWNCCGRRFWKQLGWQPAEEGSFIARERHLQALARLTQSLDRAAATRRFASNCWRRNCGWRSRRLSELRANSARTICWGRSSRGSASGNSP